MQVMEAWLELARAYMEAGDVTSATQCHQEGFNLTPEGRAVMCMQAGFYQVPISLSISLCSPRARCVPGVFVWHHATPIPLCCLISPCAFLQL